MRALALATVSAAAIAVPAGGVSAPDSSGVLDKLREVIAAGLILLATVFVNAGAAIVTNRMTQAGTAPKNIGWGTGTVAAAVGDTALGTEVAPTTAGGRTVGTESRTTITNANDNYQVVGTVTQTAAGPVAITEAGLFDAVSAGAMLIRSVFAAVNTSLNDSIAFTFGLKFVPG
jgi:hypothetical protein